MPKFNAWLVVALLCLPILASSAQEKPDLPEGATLIPDVSMTLSDGTRLATDIVLPAGVGPFPVMLWRNPYNKDGTTYGEGREYVEDGYAVVSQDVRGKFKSEGVWDPFRYESRDGKETLEWIASQEWCNGKIGLAGGSYLGFTQCINAPNAIQALASMSPVVPWGNTYHDLLYWGGAFRLQLGFFWGSLQALQDEGKPAPDFITGDLLKKLPLATWDENVGLEIGYLRDWIEHNTHDDYWKDHEVGDRVEDVTIPALYIGGWYDIFQNGTVDYWNGVRTRSKSLQARERQHLIMGPWTHGISPKDGQVGELNFGEASNIHPGRLRKEWFAETLKGEDHGFSEFPPFRLFVMGANVWRDEKEWPLARTEYKDFYLRATGAANTSAGSGALAWEPLQDNRDTETFIYDPANPVPTQGGSLLWPTAGPRNQSEIEKRKDVLVFTSEVLGETVEVTGPVHLRLFAASTAPDTDFTAKLVDVHPSETGDGTPYNITDGILRASFRESDKTPSPIEPGKVYEYDIHLGYTSNAFLPGHRIRVEISSSNFPRFDRNPNTGHPFGSDDVIATATQTVYHSAEYPSRLVLPVIPN
jgi:putative CocE/NonD family hydrolase